ncbi:hypothetical protein PCANC_04585 [Puccinia coronata f. sp. avenae]|uniref:Uncharacterized protein n=1 Tax=Puccinia coronata f. sp. avenae TaxID=200324 RepID=A0A2N5W0F8_9BASI|nr:hypothetical protein PCANC_21546 [Puccinia coronata f. sp. avenae]PLW52416.1 hypothetical protein PCASD_00040 [Puccinia coronata f. sp. avenae]PLW55705.1 hypothetical protein PCANC_04585 [Puccinia coronata f. sp. avenae]
MSALMSCMTASPLIEIPPESVKNLIASQMSLGKKQQQYGAMEDVDLKELARLCHPASWGHSLD